jgi:hypothetical protein
MILRNAALLRDKSRIFFKILRTVFEKFYFDARELVLFLLCSFFGFTSTEHNGTIGCFESAPVFFCFDTSQYALPHSYFSFAKQLVVFKD